MTRFHVGQIGKSSSGLDYRNTADDNARPSGSDRGSSISGTRARHGKHKNSDSIPAFFKRKTGIQALAGHHRRTWEPHARNNRQALVVILKELERSLPRQFTDNKNSKL